MLSAIVAVLAGVIATSSLIVLKKPNKKKTCSNLIFFQGWIGIALVFWGIWRVIHFVLFIGTTNSVWYIGIGVSIIEFVVGVLMVNSFISRYFLEGYEITKTIGKDLMLKLAKYQIVTGLILIVAGVLSILL